MVAAIPLQKVYKRLLTLPNFSSEMSLSFFDDLSFWLLITLSIPSAIMKMHLPDCLRCLVIYKLLSPSTMLRTVLRPPKTVLEYFSLLF